MTFQSAPRCAEAVPVMIVAGELVVNVFNFKYVADYDQTAINRLAEVVDAWMGAHYLLMLSTSLSYNQTLVRGLESSVDLTAANTTSAGVGSITGAVLPNNVAFCVTHRSGMTGRSARGRTFIPAIGEAELVATNTVSTTYKAAADAVFNTLNTNALAAGWQFSILSRVNAGVKRSTAVAYTIVSSEARNSILDSQRGRLPDNH